MTRPLLALSLLVAMGGSPAMGVENQTEYGTKAKLMLVVMPYVEWASEAKWKPGPFQIAVLGESPFGSRLDEGAKTLTIHHRPIRIQYVSRLREAEGCQALFICASEVRRIDSILAWAQGKEILTIGDDEELVKRGVMFNLVLQGDFVRLVVNPDAARASGLTFGSQVKALARIVSTQRPTP